jgi:hypothetical protein
LTSDFLVQGRVWLEVDGFRGGRPPRLQAKFQEKLDFYSTHGYEYLVIKPHLPGWEAIILNNLI